MLTIFTTPRPLGNRQYETAFRNAVRSWKFLEPKPEILVFGGDKNIIAQEGCRRVIGFPSTPEGLPFFDSFIRMSQELASNDLLMYCTDHLILFYDLMPTLALIRTRFPAPEPFLAIGRRWDMKMNGLLNFSNPTWADDLRQRTIHGGHYQSVGAKDYIIFRRPIRLNIPKFVVGRPWYDSWVVCAALDAGIPVVDLSRAVMTVHPSHGFPFPGGIRGREQDKWTVHNAELAKGTEGRGHTTDAQWLITTFDVVNREQLRRMEFAQ